MAIKEVATQGRHDHQQWVISYSISSSVDGTDWVMYMEGSAEKASQLFLCVFNNQSCEIARNIAWYLADEAVGRVG